MLDSYSNNAHSNLEQELKWAEINYTNDPSDLNANDKLVTAWFYYSCSKININYYLTKDEAYQRARYFAMNNKMEPNEYTGNTFQKILIVNKTKYPPCQEYAALKNK